MGGARVYRDASGCVNGHTRERGKEVYQTGCTDVGRALRNKLGLGALPLAPVPRRVDPSAVLGRPFRDAGTVRLRMIPGELADA